MNSLALRILAQLVGAGFAFGVGWYVNGWRLGQQIAKIERDQVEAAATASETARLKERAWNKQLEDARNEATKREATIRADAAAAHNAADGLRGDIADLRRQLPELAADACRQRADTLADVLSQCTARYSGMAETADRLVNDRQTLIDAWPK
ncbi:DUF2514 family protein [Noviherbaspirillum autotrophicum]|uniref:Uncharacterized protein n=1 Tax=Noviherbaspirillum autotrophicum TaxID=709839 RepID=A0A0C1YJT8_9BURK|nr:DUF2514 family protein [Noviherbaspirillum autotrophicum]KIF80767.1 hypothetical protein TSA66_07940 [Noviherbaspirillum autotrophicum]KIF80804.1 hypothetical protein TSA66_08185 [Noviherbaspirillum autotrophicum]KIF84029.1 hypothetical protein TSA66_00875 [Noviherbaspirillum autotrophicum]